MFMAGLRLEALKGWGVGFELLWVPQTSPDALPASKPSDPETVKGFGHKV